MLVQIIAALAPQILGSYQPKLLQDSMDGSNFFDWDAHWKRSSFMGYRWDNLDQSRIVILQNPALEKIYAAQFDKCIRNMLILVWGARAVRATMRLQIIQSMNNTISDLSTFLSVKNHWNAVWLMNYSKFQWSRVLICTTIYNILRTIKFQAHPIIPNTT